jgi:hypothetical protein
VTRPYLSSPMLSRRLDRDRQHRPIEYVMADGSKSGFTEIEIDGSQVCIEKASGGPEWGWFAFGLHEEELSYELAFCALQQFLRGQGIELRHGESHAERLRKCLAGDVSEHSERPR